MRELLNKLFEVVAAPVDLEKKMRDCYKAKINTKLIKSTLIGEEYYFKFWLLTNGDVVPVEHSHPNTAIKAAVDHNQLRKTGALIGSILAGELSLTGDYRKPAKFTSAQISKLKNLYIEYKITKLVVVAKEYFDTPVKSSKELAYYLEYGKEEFESKIEDDLLEKTLQVDEFDVKKALRTAAVAGVIGAVPFGLGYRKGLSQKPIEKPAATAVAEKPAEWQTIRMQVTAYCPCPKCTGTGSPGITASGHKIQSGDAFAAADKRYSFGTEMIIPGYNDDQPVEVLDRGGAIKGDRIDVFFPTHEEALEWGVKDIDVKVHIE